MKRFIKKTILLVAVTFACLLMVDGVFSLFLLKSSYRPVVVLRNILDGNINADVLVMGNSRAWVQYDPVALDTVLYMNTYNLGVDGCQINRQIQLYNLYRLHNPHTPKIIIHNIDSFSLYYSNKYEIEQFYPFLWSPSLREEIISNVTLPIEGKYIPLARYRLSLPHIVKNLDDECLYKGYKGKDMKWDGLYYQKMGSYVFSSDERVISMLESHLTKCREEGINLVFVYAPMYAGAKEKMKNADEMYNTYQTIADKFDIPVLDYSDMWICKDTSFFYNAMHMNRRGAEIFSDSLAHDIKNISFLSGHEQSGVSQ